MKRIVMTLCGLALIIAAMAQSTVALEDKPHTLRDRYYLMKANSQTFQDYKVIKEFILDGVWKITTDSLNKNSKQLVSTNLKIDSLKKEVSRTSAELKSKSDSMTDIVFASNHVTAFGANFSKGSFLAIVSLIVAVLLSTIIVLLIRMSEMQKFVSESKLIIDGINNEFEEYKHKTLEKQIKLARELQTERNKLQELGTQKSH